MPDEDVVADMWYTTVNTTRELGYHQYEVSSFALDGLESNQSVHNSGYWRGRDYMGNKITVLMVGIGPGAHGRLFYGHHRYRTFRILEPNAWMHQVETMGHG
jgi:coproporphyrinogen III oxidase-like Fe-S oxidoreductase